MSPAEAIFVMHSIVFNKASSEEWQVAPEQWEVEAKKRLAGPVRPIQPQAPRMFVKKASTTSVAVLRSMQAVREAASVEGSEITRRVHEFLDAIGL